MYEITVHKLTQKDAESGYKNTSIEVLKVVVQKIDLALLMNHITDNGVMMSDNTYQVDGVMSNIKL